MRYCYQCCIIAAPRPQIWIILLTGFCFLVKRRIEYIYLHTLGGDLRMKVDNFFWLKRHNQQTKFANLSTLKRKQKSDNSNPQILPHQRRNSPPSSQRQKIDQRYPPKCGLGASVECERIQHAATKVTFRRISLVYFRLLTSYFFFDPFFLGGFSSLLLSMSFSIICFRI